MTHRPIRRRAERSKTSAQARSRRTRLVSALGRQIDAIYLQLDTELTRMARIQLQFDEVRSKIRRL